METVEYMWVNIWCMLITSGERGKHLTIQLLWATAGLLVTRFIVLSTQWMKEMRTWDRSEVASYCFSVWCESSSLLQLKTRAQGQYLMCIASVKITELEGKLKCQQGDIS